MRTETKIDKLEAALRRGDHLSPLDAWVRWSMQANTFNRSLFALKKKGLPIQSRKVDGGQYSYCVHWMTI